MARRSSIPLTLGTDDFCRLIEMSPRGFDKQRERERAAADVSAAMSAERFAMSLPFSVGEAGGRARFNFRDALGMRLCLELEKAGMRFCEATQVIRTSGFSGFWNHDEQLDGDYFAGFWVGSDGIRHPWFGNASQLARSAPASPAARLGLNVSATVEALRKRARDVLQLEVRGVNFFALEGAR